MSGKIVFENQYSQSSTNFGNLGEFAWRYKGVNYYVGDIVFIMTEKLEKKKTLIIKHDGICSVNGFMNYTINGSISEEVTELKVIKRFKKLRHNEQVDGYRIKLDKNRDANHEIACSRLKEKLQGHEVQTVNIAEKFTAAEVELNCLLDNYKTLTADGNNRLKAVSKQYTLLSEIIKERQMI